MPQHARGAMTDHIFGCHDDQEFLLLLSLNLAGHL